MQNLLTKGISHTKFKDSEIGKIPEEWKLYSMKEFGKWVGGGTPSKQRKDFWDNSGILWISPKDMKSLEIQNSKEKITKLGLDNSSAQGIKLNSILMVVRSGILTRNFPVAITKKTVTVNQDLKGIIVNDQFNPKYILHLLLFYNNLIRLSCMKRGTTVHSMDVKLLMKFKLAVPSINEQNTIEEILSNIDSKIVNLNNKKNTLKKLKSDLIQKLTIGQIRVKV